MDQRDPQQRELERSGEVVQDASLCPVHQAPVVADLLRGHRVIRPLCVTCVVEHTYDKRREGEVQLRLL